MDSGINGWTRIGKLDDIPSLGSRVVATPIGDIAIIRAGDDQVFAVRDRCPHKGGPLSQGIIHGHKVTCPLHNWVIELKTGEAVGPDEGKVACFAVRVEDGIVSVRLKSAHT